MCCAALSSCLLSMCASNCVRDWTALTVRLDLCVLVLAFCVHSTWVCARPVRFDIWYEGHLCLWRVLRSFWCCFHLSSTFSYVFCLYWLSCTLFPVAVQRTHCCHVPVPPFCSLDWRTCLWLVSLLFLVASLCFESLTVIENLVYLLLKRRVFCLWKRVPGLGE